ncbi:hypothetical protein HC891_06425 [Candidatus Gracilibacteria bacterium]|nr:hypothetical protein [Candidatus Gracilibacteria bacterium]
MRQEVIILAHARFRNGWVLVVVAAQPPPPTSTHGFLATLFSACTSSYRAAR